jgi:hypothetical protein
MLLQLSMSQTRQVISVVVFVWTHTLFSLGPEPRSPLIRRYLEVFLIVQVEVSAKRGAVLALVSDVRKGLGSEGF